MKYFLIEEQVHVPKLKIIGIISDKLYGNDLDEIKLKIIPNYKETNKVYPNSLLYINSSYWVKYSKGKVNGIC